MFYSKVGLCAGLCGSPCCHVQIACTLPGAYGELRRVRGMSMAVARPLEMLVMGRTWPSNGSASGPIPALRFCIFISLPSFPVLPCG